MHWRKHEDISLETDFPLIVQFLWLQVNTTFIGLFNMTCFMTDFRRCLCDPETDLHSLILAK